MPVNSESDILSFPQSPDIKAMAQEQGLCLSFILPLELSSLNLEQRLKNALLSARETLHLSKSGAEPFLSPLESMSAADLRRASESAKGLAFYSSGEKSWRFLLPFPVQESVHFAEHYFVTPLLKAAQMDQKFYILPLSQKHVRLIRCTLDSSQEVELPATVP